MAGFEAFQKEEGHVLKDVDVQAPDSKLDADLVKELLKPVRESRTVGQLHSSILNSLKTLDQLKVFRHCSVTVNSGSEADMALVEYDFQWLPWFSLSSSLHRTSEGGRISPALRMLNLRSKADITSIGLDVKPNTRTWGIRADHRFPAFQPGKWVLGLNYHARQRVLDESVIIREHGEFLEIEEVDGRNRVRLSRDVRRNYPLIDRAALSTLQKGILTSEKYAVTHEFTVNELDDASMPTSGYFIKAANELAFGHQQLHHVLSLCGQSFIRMHKNLSLEFAVGWQWLLPWEFSKVHYNDALRVGFTKGFKWAGPRQPPVDESLSQRCNGDSIGTSNLLHAEAKLHFHKAPFFHSLSAAPFLYASVFGMGLDLRSRSPLRGSCGFGIDWYTRWGRVELTYAAKVVARPGDVPAQFQVLFYE